MPHRFLPVPTSLWSCLHGPCAGGLFKQNRLRFQKVKPEKECCEMLVGIHMEDGLNVLMGSQFLYGSPSDCGPG